MNTLDIRGAAPAASGTTRPSSKGQQPSAGFDDAVSAIGDRTAPSGKAKSDPVADEQGPGRSAKGLSWDPRMKQAGDARNGEDAEATAHDTDDAGKSGAKVATDGKLDGTTATGDPGEASGDDDRDGKHDDAPNVVAVAITTPTSTLATAARSGEASVGPASPRSVAKAGLVAEAAAKPARTTAADPAPAATRTLAAPSEAGQARGSSALAGLGSKLAELAHGAEAPREDAERKALAGQAKARTGPAPADAHGADHGSKPHDRAAATPKAETPDAAVALRLPAAPAATPGRNAAALAAAVVSDPAWARALAAESTAGAQRGPQPGAVNALRIQLHPADLGVVTATLRLEGQHLVINLKVETAAAYRQLSADNRAIVDKLKGHGYVVESIAVQHVPVDRGAAPQPQQATAFAGHQQHGGQPMPNGGGQRFDQGAPGNGGGSRSSGEPATGARETVAPVASADPRTGDLYL